MVSNIPRACAFIFVASSKTLYNIGSAFLTVDATVNAMFCLVNYNNKKALPSKGLEGFNLSLQIIAATFSTLLVMMSRYPAIWDKLSIKNLKDMYEELKDEVSDCGRGRKALLLAIVIFGFLACVARGLSAYLGTEVILRERFTVAEKPAIAVQSVVGATVMISSMCFNLSNMLTSAAKTINSPKKISAFKAVFGFVAILTGAVVMRFFIKSFLDRCDASETVQVIGQGVAFFAEFVMGLFTMGASFEGDVFQSTKKNLCSSKLFATMVIGDVITTWLGHTLITLYDVLSDIVIAGSAVGNHQGQLCPSDQSAKTQSTRVAFFVAALVLAVPMVTAYFNYLLSYSKKGYDDFCSLFPRKRGPVEARLLGNDLAMSPF